jgi:hypothetical protein
MPIKEHIFGSRNNSLTGKGGFLSARLRIDARLLYFLNVESDIKLFKHKNYSFEQHTALHVFLLRNLSLTIGYTASLGHFNNTFFLPEMPYLSKSNLFLMPYGDITVYFGKKKNREVGLFGNGR